MRTQIDYLADKYCFTERNESPRLRQQWQDVLEECRQTEAGPEERLRIALLNVDYGTSFELPFRLLLTRTVTNGAIVIHTQRLKSDPGGNLLS